jgi:peptide/nickel transport system permease protein
MTTQAFDSADPVAFFRSSSIPWLMVAGISIILFWVFIALLAPVITPYNPTATDLTAALKPPLTPGHLLGTDNVGRDILARIIYGTRVNLPIGLIGVILPFITGTTLGLIAGYFGGIIDAVLMRLLDIAAAFPFIILVLAIVAMLGPGLNNFYISLAIVAWVPYARLVRAEVLVLRNAEFVQAARILGFSAPYIMLKHVLPNAISTAVVFVTTDIILTILLGSGVSFFGLGVQPPTPEWGSMIAQAQTYITTAWWISVFPGIAIIFLALGFALLGDGLAHKLKVRL